MGTSLTNQVDARVLSTLLQENTEAGFWAAAGCCKNIWGAENPAVTGNHT